MKRSTRDKASQPRRLLPAAAEAGRLQKTVEALTDTVGRQQQLVDTLSHVMCNPLSLILGPADWLARIDDGADLDEVRRQGRLLQRNAQSIQRLMEYARQRVHIDRVALETRACTVNLADALGDALRRSRARIAQRQIRLTVTLNETDLCAELDPNKLELILGQLFARAVEETPDQGNLVILVTPTDIEPFAFEVRVKHSGAIEEPADRVDAIDLVTVSGEPAAFWHDLSTINELVKGLGGELHLQVEQGFSTEYVVRLPGRVPDAMVLNLPPLGMGAWEGGEEEALDPLPAGVSHLGAKSTAHDEDRLIVLIVDDNPDFRFYLRSCLERLYDVEEAADGREGLEKAKDIVPDLIVSDVMMPYVDGHTFCRQVKADDALNHIPVILATALSAAEHRVQGLEAGADAYLIKPFDSKILLAQVKSLLTNRRRLSRHYSQKVLIEPLDITVPSVDELFLEEAQMAVERHMADEFFNLDAFAEALAMSPRQLQRKMKSMLGMTPMTYVRVLRLKRGAQLLEQNAGNVSQVAYQVGFSSARHFTRCFTRFFGKSPSAVREG